MFCSLRKLGSKKVVTVPSLEQIYATLKERKQTKSKDDICVSLYIDLLWFYLCRIGPEWAGQSDVVAEHLVHRLPVCLQDLQDYKVDER